MASSASAIPIPWGSSTDTGSTSVYGLFNQASAGLVQAQNLIVGANALSQAPFSYGTAVDPKFTTNFTSASSLTSDNVAEIGTDIAASANTSQMEMSVCVFDVYPTQTHDTNTQNAFMACTATNSPYFAAAAAAYAPATTSGTIQNGVASAAASWPELDSLLTQLEPFGGVLNSADSATVSSSGTVVSTTQPMAYNINVNAPSGGYILPSAFSLTFPAGLGVNVGLVADEVNAAANGTTPSAIAAIEANPTGTAIGTVTVTSPAADAFGGTNNQIVGKVYVVTTGASSGQGSATQPYIELWLGDGLYDLGSFPSKLQFPLTLSFGEATTPLGQEPLPFSSLAVSFPAATSPVKATSCTSLGTVGGTATDAVAGLALEFGDTHDGLTSATGTPAAVTLASTPTAVTDQCTATVTKKPIKNTVTGSMGGLKTGRPTLTLRIRTGSSFGTVTVGLPRGLSFVKSKRLAKEISASSAGVRSARIAHGRLVIALRKRVKSTTVKTRRGAIAESAALIKSIKKHRTKKLSVSVHAGSISLRASIKA